MFNSFQKPSTSLSQYESSIDTSNIIPQNQALKQIKKALLGCGLLNTFDINKANGDHTGTKFSRSLNTRPINTVTIKNLSESVKQHSLYSLDVDKCLHMFCKRSDINLETLSPNWENLKPIKFSPSAKNIKLANGSHRVHYMKLLRQSYIKRIVQALRKQCEALGFWGVKLYDLDKIWLRNFWINFYFILFCL